MKLMERARSGDAGTVPASARPDRLLVPVPEGKNYSVASAPEAGEVRPELARELARVLDRFAAGAGFGPGRRVSIEFRPGVVGHHKVGRAADIYGVGGRSIDAWRRSWERAVRPARRAGGGEGRRILGEEYRRNLGWRLYRALRDEGRWARPEGYPVQLFGPWTRADGPWRRISDPLLRAHADHIHVAR